MIAAVLFDLDDTLHDRDGSLRRFLADQHGRLLADRVERSLYIERFVTLDARGHFAKTLLYPQLLAELAIGDVAAERLVDDYNRHYRDHARVFDGAAETLAALRGRGIKLGIVSNGWTDFQMRTVDGCGLRDLVDAILISEAEGLRKPDSRLFERAAERLGVAPRDCLFVGDNPAADILGAHAVGMRTAWFPGGLPWPEGVANPGATIGRLSEVMALLD
jgi:putative hydrolase of the HAD superfamily